MYLKVLLLLKRLFYYLMCCKLLVYFLLPASALTDTPYGRNAMVGGIVLDVIFVIFVIIVGLIIGYFKGKQRDDFIDNNYKKRRLNEQKLVEKSKHSDSAKQDTLLNHKDAEPNSHVHA